MARVGIELKFPEYMLGALPLSYLALGDQIGLLIMSCVTNCFFNSSLNTQCELSYELSSMIGQEEICNLSRYRSYSQRCVAL
jgi:hypothetical protein